MTCDACTHAQWERTKNGRLHPSRAGRCGKQVTLPVLPEAFYWIESARIGGGCIMRGRHLKTPCFHYQEP